MGTRNWSVYVEQAAGKGPSGHLGAPHETREEAVEHRHKLLRQGGFRRDTNLFVVCLDPYGVVGEPIKTN